MESRTTWTHRLIRRARRIVESARSNVQRARANNIRAVHLAEKAKSTCYENHLIRRLKR